MNTPSASRADTVRVWDPLLRIFHWSLAVCFLGAFLTAESERWRHVHVALGYTVAGLVAFRIVWGLIGPRHARFAQFVRGPAAVLRYLRSLASSRPEHHVGHNPAGALAIVAMLVLAALSAGTGWVIENGAAAHWLEELHEGAANTLLALVGVHIAALLASSWLHCENLVRAMITGRKRAGTDG